MSGTRGRWTQRTVAVLAMAWLPLLSVVSGLASVARAASASSAGAVSTFWVAANVKVADRRNTDTDGPVSRPRTYTSSRR